MTMVTARPVQTRRSGRSSAGQFDSVYRVVTIVASHPSGWTEAAMGGIAELAKTITDLRVARVVERDTVIRYGRIAAYRVKLQVSFRIDARRLIGGEAVAVRRCLVVANETATSPSLAAVLRDRLDAGPCELHLLVPLRVPPLAGSTLMVRPWSDRTVRDRQAAEAAQNKARHLAEARLSPLVEQLRREGAPTTWETSF